MMIQMENTIHGLSTRLAEKDKEVLALQNTTHILTETNAQKDRLVLQLSSNLTVLQFEGRRIAFHARMSTDKTHLASFATVKFETVVTNEGQAYSPVTGVFTCPQDGTYSFSWTLITLAGNWCNTEFVVDGNIIAYTHDEANSSTDHKTSSQSAVVLLKKGNKTWIRAYRSQAGRCYPTWSSYSGFKV
ncbi:complement C1q tumor necrosis factor-related protein 7-like [Mytilus trossulus]|uniref:complement C1q tumor necrosis factor-related protein 7-like n=1 Tax=Mytilus trossulus TaxID=6551 RepID=UPI0030064E20